MIENKGFSLIEVITASTIFCVSSILSYPLILNLKASTITRSAVEQIIADLYYAKVAAINANSFAVVHFSENGYTIFIDDGAKGTGLAGDWEQQEAERTVLERILPEGMSLNGNFPPPSNKMRFRGVAGIRAGSLIINGLNDSVYKVAFSRAGRLRTEKL